MDTVLKAVGAIVLVVLLVMGLSLAFTYPIMWAINYAISPTAISAVFGVAKLTFWKTYVFAALCGWLFKGTSTTKEK